MKKLLVLFDIDGTLLYATSTKYRQRFAYAIEKIHGVLPSYEWDHLEGMIDHGLFLHGLQKANIPESQYLHSMDQLHEVAYEYFTLNVIEEEYKQTVLKGAEPLLKKLQHMVHLGILTGNYEKTAWKKLDIVGLRNYFEFGIFGHEAETRIQLAKKVQTKAQKHFGRSFHHEEIIFVGDTPRDIECARSIDSHVIAVATGKFTEDQLKLYNPDLLVSSLEDKRIIPYIQEIHRYKQPIRKEK